LAALVPVGWHDFDLEIVLVGSSVDPPQGLTQLRLTLRAA
jgi:hypothetical protein